jgi:hypothetical protein
MQTNDNKRARKQCLLPHHSEPQQPLHAQAAGFSRYLTQKGCVLQPAKQPLNSLP